MTFRERRRVVGEWLYEGAGVGASCWQRRPHIAFAVCWSTQPGRVRAAILPGSYRAREAAPDMIKSPSATRKAMKKSGLRDAVDAPVRPQVRPAHVGSRDPDDGIRRCQFLLVLGHMKRTQRLLCMGLFSKN